LDYDILNEIPELLDYDILNEMDPEDVTAILNLHLEKWKRFEDDQNQRREEALQLAHVDLEKFTSQRGLLLDTEQTACKTQVEAAAEEKIAAVRLRMEMTLSGGNPILEMAHWDALMLNESGDQEDGVDPVPPAAPPPEETPTLSSLQTALNYASNQEQARTSESKREQARASESKREQPRASKIRRGPARASEGQRGQA
jgi:hypothetical protein